MKNPRFNQLPLPVRVTAATIALAGALSLAGCMNTNEGYLESPSMGPAPTATSEAAVLIESFDLGTLEINKNGICEESSLGKVSMDDCRVLPKITDGASFDVINEPDEKYGAFDEKRVIAEVKGDDYQLEKLPKAYQEALKNIFNKGMPKAALKKGTKFVFEQYSDDREKFPEYEREIDTVRYQFATNGAEVTIGELGSILEHESAHAVESNWDWGRGSDKELNDAYTMQLYYSIDRITKEHGTELISKLDELSQFIQQEYDNGKMKKETLSLISDNLNDLKELIEINELDSALVRHDIAEDNTKDQGGSVAYVRRVIFEGVSDEDVLSLPTEFVDKTREFDTILDDNMVDDFSYVTEYRILPGMVNWNLGHPWDERSEYIASLFTIVAYAPEQFMNYVNGIKGDNAPFVKSLILKVAQKFQTENPEEYAASNFPRVVDAMNK